MAENDKIHRFGLPDKFGEYTSVPIPFLCGTGSLTSRITGGGGITESTRLHGIAHRRIMETVPIVFEMQEWDTCITDCTVLNNRISYPAQ